MLFYLFMKKIKIDIPCYIDSYYDKYYNNRIFEIEGGEEHVDVRNEP